MTVSSWNKVKLPEGTELLRKESFQFRVLDEEFNIELFESLTGEYYAIGTQVDSDRLVIYGSAIVSDPVKALEQTMHKITREATQQEIQQIGEDTRGINLE